MSPAASSFTATQSDVGGNITFSNSGKRGTVKEFTLGLDSFITIIKDIKSNINSFRAHKNYIEKEWRDLGSEFYSDGPANAMSTVQTKPLFTTISKIIASLAGSFLNNSVKNGNFDQILSGLMKNLNNNNEALESFIKAYTLAGERKQMEDKKWALYMIASVYNDIRDYKNALLYYKKFSIQSSNL